jgi:TolB-like protein/DNA-binding winged helix-turn-helix (wHTH) protein
MLARACSFDDFELDPSACELRRNGQSVRLERIPFELLCLLIEEHARVVTREEILERIWGKGVFIDSQNSINAAVRKIRRALNDDADAPRFIITVPARGYRFVALLRQAENTAAKDLEVVPPVSTPEQPSTHFRSKTAISIAGLAFLSLAIVFRQHLSLRPVPSASIQRAEKPALPAMQLTEKPSIAVLPFTNIGGDQQQEYFSDGITDELITSLSRFQDLFVVARSSSFTYKGKSVNVREVGRELGVKYVLEGGIQKSSNQVRINVRLIEAGSGEHLWAEHYDRPLHDIFSLQDEMVRRIATTLQLQLTLWDAYGLRVARYGTENLEAYDYYLRALKYDWEPTKESYFKAEQVLQKTIALDPKFSAAYALLGWIYLIDWEAQWNQFPHAVDQAYAAEKSAVTLDEDDARAHARLGIVYVLKKRPEQALAQANRAMALAPDSGWIDWYVARIFNQTGRPAEAIGYAEKAMRLNPRLGYFFSNQLGIGYTLLGRYADAAPVLKRHVVSFSNSLSHIWLAIDYAELGQMQDAHAVVVKVLGMCPGYTAEEFGQRVIPLADADLRERFITDLRKAGLN